MQIDTQSNSDDSFDIKEAIHNILTHWYFILITIAIALGISEVYLRTKQPEYQADALMQVGTEKSANNILLGNLNSELSNSSQAQTEIEVIKSRYILDQVIDNLHLDVSVSSERDSFFSRLIRNNHYFIDYTPLSIKYSSSEANLEIANFAISKENQDQYFEILANNDSEYNLIFNGKKVAKGTVGKNEIFLLNNVPQEINITSITPKVTFYISKRSPLPALSALTRTLNISEKGKLTGILQLTFQGPDKTFVSRVLNEILTVYANQNFDQKSAETNQTLEFLEKKLPELKNQLELSELKFNQFRRKNQTVDVSKESEILISQSNDFKTKRVELEQKKVELLSKFTEEHPLVKEINSQLSALQNESNRVTARLNMIPDIQMQYLQLFRDVQVNTELYTSLLNNYQQLKVVKASQIANIRILDKAITPIKQISPNTQLIPFLAAIVGMIFGILAVLLRSFLYSGIRDSSKLESNFGIPIMATVPRSKTYKRLYDRFGKKHNSLLAVTDNEDMALESLKSLRTVVHFATNKSKNVVMISGGSPGIGKSFISANFSAVLAQSGKRVLLVDCDLRRGHLHQYFETRRDNGLADYLSGKHPDLSKIIKPTIIDNLEFISTGAIPQNPAEILLTATFSELIKNLSSQYDYVIIDTPPLLAATDAMIIGKLCGLRLMVIRFAQTHMKEVEMSLSRFKQTGVNFDGFVLNDIQQDVAGRYAYQFGYEYRSTKH